MRVAQLGKTARKARGVPVFGKTRKPAKGMPVVVVLPEQVRDVGSDPAEAGHAIQGSPASDIEWAVYRALRSLGWDDDRVRFEVSFQGGRAMVGGGQVLDFIVDTGTVPVVVDVRGRQFHGASVGKSSRDRMREMQILATSPTPRLLVIWEEVAHQWEQLRALLLREVGARK